MFYFLFGQAGAGKNYIGSLLAQHFGFYFWDADEALTPEMKDYIAKKKIFTLPMRDEFADAIIDKIKILIQQHENIIVAQALYKEKNRMQIAAAFPEAKFILIEASPELILERLKIRNNDVDQAYAEKIKSQFEPPVLTHAVINNTTEADIIKQFQIT